MLDHRNLWIRNSVKFKRSIFGVSDIDVTVFLKSASNIPKRIWRFRKYFFLGEINCYLEDSVETFLPLANYYELKRDPDLFSRYSRGLAEREFSKKLFIVRMVQSDRKNFYGNFKRRQHKWRYLFEICNLDYNDFSQNFQYNYIGMIEFLEKNLFGPNDPLKTSDYLRMTYQNPFYFDKQWFVSNQWLKWFLVFDSTSFFYFGSKKNLGINMSNFILLDRNDRSFMLENLRWEIWGIYSQFYLDEVKKDHYFEYLQNINVFLDNLTVEEARDMKCCINFLIDSF